MPAKIKSMLVRSDSTVDDADQDVETPSHDMLVSDADGSLSINDGGIQFVTVGTSVATANCPIPMVVQMKPMVSRWLMVAQMKPMVSMKRWWFR